VRATTKPFEKAAALFGIDITKRGVFGNMTEWDALQGWRMFYAGWRAAKLHTKKRKPR